MSGPALGLVSQAIRLWLRSLCSHLDHLDLQLEGSMLRLMSGHLQGARVQADGLVFQGLAIDAVQLCSEPISIDVTPLLQGKPLQLRQRFTVQGWVRFNEEGLNRCLQSPALQGLASELAETLLNGEPLGHFGLQSTGVELASQQGRQCHCQLLLEHGALLLRHGVQQVEVPMDPAITIEQLELSTGQLRLSGRSLVSPTEAAPG